jgi:hypothetical protein
MSRREILWKRISDNEKRRGDVNAEDKVESDEE